MEGKEGKKLEGREEGKEINGREGGKEEEGIVKKESNRRKNRRTEYKLKSSPYQDGVLDKFNQLYDELGEGETDQDVDQIYEALIGNILQT